jgi:large subunit ribosomal protein L13
MAKLIYDGSGAVFGRMASVVSKELLKGNYVFVVNCEAVVVSGEKKIFVEKLLAKLRMGRGSSMKGPKYIKRSDRLLKRMIRGMLPWDRAKGREAYKRLMCFVGTGDLKEEELKNARVFKHQMPRKYSTIKEIVEAIS